MYYPFDISEFTQEEQEELERLSIEYFDTLRNISMKIDEIEGAGGDTSALEEEYNKYMWSDPPRKYLEKLERKHFDLFNGDLDAIYKDACNRIKFLISRDLKDIVLMAEREGREPDEVSDLLTSDAIRKRTRYHLKMHIDALEQDFSLYDQLLKEIFKLSEEAGKKGKSKPNAITITESGVEKADYPVDKVNSSIFRDLREADPHGQLFFIDTINKGKEKQPLVMCSINFDDIEAEGVVKRLTAIDKRVYIAVNALYSAGYDYITITQIYHVYTGRDTSPNAKDKEKINRSLTKMAARMYLDNKTEVEKGYKYSRFKYDGPLLPFERVESSVNNQITDTVIRILRPADETEWDERALPLVKFAKSRNQYTTISSACFGALSITEDNLLIEDYLIEQIARIKNPANKTNNKLLYETIYKNTSQNARYKKTRAKDKIKKILDHLKKANYIYGYIVEEDGVTIIPRKPVKKIGVKKKPD